jgi:hypothetical protein
LKNPGGAQDTNASERTATRSYAVNFVSNRWEEERHMRVEILKAVKMSMLVFGDVTP